MEKVTFTLRGTLFPFEVSSFLKIRKSREIRVTDFSWVSRKRLNYVRYQRERSTIDFSKLRKQTHPCTRSFDYTVSLQKYVSYRGRWYTRSFT